MSTRTSTLEERLYGALGAYRDAQEREPSREGAIIVRNLEDAVLWNDAKRAKKGLDPLGLEWKP